MDFVVQIKIICKKNLQDMFKFLYPSLNKRTCRYTLSILLHGCERSFFTNVLQQKTIQTANEQSMIDDGYISKKFYYNCSFPRVPAHVRSLLVSFFSYVVERSKRLGFLAKILYIFNC